MEFKGTKAPEMLEILQDIVNEFSEDELKQCLPSFALKINKAKQLIKEVTEL